AALQGEFYLRSLMPLLALAVIGTFIYAFTSGLATSVGKRERLVFLVVGLAFLVSLNRFVFHAFYLNGHLLLGASVLVIATSMWLVEVNPRRPDAHGLATLSAAAIATGVLARPEGALFLFVLLVPLTMTPSIPLAYKRALLAVLGITMSLWF